MPAMDIASPTCKQRWQTALFRANLPQVFFAANEYIDKWQAGADSGGKLVQYLATIADFAMFAQSTMKLNDGASRAAQILIRGHSSLLMLGFEVPEETPGLKVAGEAVKTLRSGLEAMVAHSLGVAPDPLSLAPVVVELANNLLSYANTVRYARLRNTYTLSLEYLRRLYRVGGDQGTFARSLGLASSASVPECLNAVNKRAFGFTTRLTDAGGYSPTLAEKIVNYWTVTISDYANLQQP